MSTAKLWQQAEEGAPGEIKEHKAHQFPCDEHAHRAIHASTSILSIFIQSYYNREPPQLGRWLHNTP